MTNKITNILIYNGPGTSKKNIDQIESLLIEKTEIDNLKITLINYKNIKQEGLKNCSLFILPGGRDKLYAKYLNGECNKIIKDYVRSGGSFLGICAGAYYSGTKVEFAKNSKKEIVEDRELGIFNGKVIGPILSDYFYNSTKGSKAAKINIENDYSYVHYNGGGYFENYDPSVEVISYYHNLDKILPAIIKIKAEKGMAILSGVHFEYCNPKNYNHTKKENIALLKSHDEVNILFFNKLITMLLKKL